MLCDCTQGHFDADARDRLVVEVRAHGEVWPWPIWCVAEYDNYIIRLLVGADVDANSTLPYLTSQGFGFFLHAENRSEEALDRFRPMIFAPVNPKNHRADNCMFR